MTIGGAVDPVLNDGRSGLGVDNRALYITSNMFAFGGNFQYAKIRVIKAGPHSEHHDFVKLKNADNTMAFTIQPCHTFGAPGAEYLVNTGFPSGNLLTLWEITNPTAATPTRKQVSISAYSLPPNGPLPARRAKDRGNRGAARHMIDVHRRKTALVMMCVPERELLAAMRGTERVVDVQDHERARFDRRPRPRDECRPAWRRPTTHHSNINIVLVNVPRGVPA
jgi:hypothetical protein